MSGYNGQNIIAVSGFRDYYPGYPVYLPGTGPIPNTQPNPNSMWSQQRMGWGLGQGYGQGVIAGRSVTPPRVGCPDSVIGCPDYDQQYS